MSHRHYDPFAVRPVERRCICPKPARKPGEHTPACGEQYRKDFLGLKQDTRDMFYDTPRSRSLDSPAEPCLNTRIPQNEQRSYPPCRSRSTKHRPTPA